MYSIIYSLIPFILLLVSSLLLIYEMKRNNRRSRIFVYARRQENAKSLNKTVVFIAILFIIMTLPGAVVTSFLNEFLQTSGDLGNLIINLCDCFTFSFHALNFIILYLNNKRFSKEVRVFLKIDRGLTTTLLLDEKM